jgi:tripartite-type tricarboxylate transporter receptor subunit TctC
LPIPKPLPHRFNLLRMIIAGSCSNIRASGGAQALCQKPSAAASQKRGSAVMTVISVRRAAAAATLAAGFAAAALPAWPQTYPSRPIRLIVNFPPGGTGDIIGRIVGNQLAVELGQSVVVENRSGAGGTIGARDVVNAAADGYTLTVGQTPEIAINPYFMKNVGYDPLKDLQPIALAGVVPLALVVPPNSPYATAAEWVVALRSGRALTFASAGIGTPGHLAGELLKLKHDDKLVHVPYKGAGPALNDVAGGQVDFYFPGYPGAVPLMQGGRIKMLAVSTARRAPAAPDTPTVAEATGLANFDFTLWAGFFGPRGLPTDIATRLNAAINKILLEPDIKSRLQATGAELSALSIDQFSAFVRADVDRYKDIIRSGNLQPE